MYINKESGKYINRFFVPLQGHLHIDAEKQIAKSGAYHKKCFTCVKCKHQLDATNFANGPDNEVYCTYCYRYSDLALVIAKI